MCSVLLKVVLLVAEMAALMVLCSVELMAVLRVELMVCYLAASTV